MAYNESSQIRNYTYMFGGYIYLETRSDYPGIVRVKLAEMEPEIPVDPDGSDIVYIVRFDDLDAARLHFHNALKREVENLEFDTYRCSLEKAIAELESDSLRHHRVWIAPQLAADSLSKIEHMASKLQDKKRLQDRMWQYVGWLGVIWIVMLLVLL